MKKVAILLIMCALMSSFISCDEPSQTTPEKSSQWIVDRFDDIKVLKYEVPNFENLTLDERLFLYYMSQSALCGRDIIYDQNFKYNLVVRRVLEAINEDCTVERTGEQWAAFEKYLKKVWFANGVHHHYSGEKFVPEFSQDYFNSLIDNTIDEKFPTDFGTKAEIIDIVNNVLFDPGAFALNINQNQGVDMLTSSSMNYYENVKQKEAERFYSKMAATDPDKNTPISYGLNSKLVKEDGELREKVWRVGGMYSPALEKVVYWLEMAAGVANPVQKKQVEKLMSYYKSGDLKEFDEFNILWVQDTISKTDFVNGFTETYGDPLGYKASWESMVNFTNVESTKRTEIISANAQWFEDHSPIDDKYKKEEVRGVSAKVITVAMLGGDCYPSSPLGVNLPNADWLRRDYGSKSVTIENISNAINEASKDNGFLEEFMLREEDRERVKRYGAISENLHTDLHECLGHGSGRLAPGTKGDELKNYGAALEEARADLFGLYYIADPKMIELGLVPSLDVAWAQYARYMVNGMMTQLYRIKLGNTVQQAHMRNRKLVAEWCYEKGRAENVVEKVEKDGKTYIVVNDFQKLRGLFGELLKEIQRIKSEGDYRAGKNLIEKYSINIDPVFHEEIHRRYDALNIEPYTGFVNPVYNPVMENGEIVDIKLEYCDDYVSQMMEYSRNFSFLPSKN